MILRFSAVVAVMLALILSGASACNAGEYIAQLTGRDLPYNETTDIAMTIDMCIAHCDSRNMDYAGLQNGTTCRCGNSYGKYGDSGAVCDIPCTGNAGQTCGGATANSVFRVSDESFVDCFNDATSGTECRTCTCGTHGVCKNETDGGPCDCENGWGGANCTTELDPPTSTVFDPSAGGGTEANPLDLIEKNRLYLGIFSAMIAFSGVCIITAGICCLVKRNRKDKGLRAPPKRQSQRVEMH